VLKANSVTKRFGGNTVLKDVSVELLGSEILGLVGPNGSGKTTLLNCLSGFLSPDSGSITFEGHRLERMPAWKVSQSGVRRTFQLPTQPQKMTVIEVMLCGARLSLGNDPVRGMLKRSQVKREENQALERAFGLLGLLRMTGLSDAMAGQLSGGQQKLLSIGVALMDSPRVLLLDEPTAGVHPSLRSSLVERLKEIHASGTAVMVIEHDMGFISSLCERVYVLDRGEVIATCKPSELKDDPRVVEAYLGVPRSNNEPDRS
jgi:branched-chain amino acid transport system ATP-binding protein